jgi:uncharacterized protein YgiM (DUF1202 family)
MLRLTVILCAAMFAALLIGGEDRGQLRPGLANAAAEAKLTPVVVAKAEPVVVVTAEPPVAAIVPEPPAEVVTAAYAPDPVREVVAEVEEVFTLSNLPTETLPAAQEATGVEGQILYVTAESVNVREGPSTEAAVLGKLGSGEAALVITDIDGEWARIVIQGDGMEGYVAMRFLSVETP